MDTIFHNGPLSFLPFALVKWLDYEYGPCTSWFCGDLWFTFIWDSSEVVFGYFSKIKKMKIIEIKIYLVKNTEKKNKNKIIFEITLK